MLEGFVEHHNLKRCGESFFNTKLAKHFNPALLTKYLNQERDNDKMMIWSVGNTVKHPMYYQDFPFIGCDQRHNKERYVEVEV